MKYRKRPVVVEAVQWTGQQIEGCICITNDLEGIGRVDWLMIPTLEGDMRAELGDYIVTGVKGEKYPVKPEIFAMTYEPAE